MVDRWTNRPDESIGRSWRLKGTRLKIVSICVCLCYFRDVSQHHAEHVSTEHLSVDLAGLLTWVEPDFTDICSPLWWNCFVLMFRNDGLLFQYNAILDFTNVPSIKIKAIQSWLWRISGITAWHLLKSCHCFLCYFFVTSTRSHCPLFILLLLRF
jgi:hypothetical protein